MAEPERRDREFQWDHVAHDTPRIARGIIGAEGVIVRVAGVEDAAHDRWVADVLEIAMHDQPLVMQLGQRLGGVKICNPAGVVLGQEIHHLVVKPQKAQVELRDDDVFVVAHVADQCPLRKTGLELGKCVVVHLRAGNVERGIADLLLDLVKAWQVAVRIQRVVGQGAGFDRCPDAHLGGVDRVAQAGAQDGRGMLNGWV